MREPLRLQSPALRRLQQDVRKRKRDALKPFWNRVASTGTPLVERREGYRRELLLTFLWRGDPGTKRVALRSMAFGFQGLQPELLRLPGTNVCYRSYPVPNDFRDAYLFAIDEPLTEGSFIPASFRPRKPGDFGWEGGMALEKTWHLDPFNPEKTTWTPDDRFRNDPFNARAATRSLVELPEAPRHTEVTSQRGVARGALRLYRFRSQILGDTRRIWIYLPAGFQPRMRDLHVAVVFDGFWYTHIIPTPTILDNLVHENKVPPVVGVFVDSRRICTDRFRDMVFHPEPLGRFLVRELLPWVERTLGIRCRPGRTALAGASGGGLSALRYALEYPDHFRLVLSQSGSFWLPGDSPTEPGVLLREVMHQPQARLRVYMEVGLWEGTGQVLANRHLRDVLRLKGYLVTYREFNGGHEFECWRQSLVDGLVDLFGTRPG
jgi:enterochelin esterase family protein